MELLHRAVPSDLVVRSEGDGRTIAGILVPFGVSTRVSDGGPVYLEGFDRGAFADTIRSGATRIKLLSQHNSRSNPLGRAALLREDTAGLYGEFRVSRTNAGDEALELVKDGALDSFSIGFAPVRQAVRDKVTWRSAVRLREASLVTFPAYDDARVSGVRADLPAALFGLTDAEREQTLALLRRLRNPAAGSPEPGFGARVR